jgi:hypothetical protein
MTKRKLADADIDIDALTDAIQTTLTIDKKPRLPESPPIKLGSFDIPFQHTRHVYSRTDVEAIIEAREARLYGEYLALLDKISALKERIHFLDKELLLERSTGCALAYRKK